MDKLREHIERLLDDREADRSERAARARLKADVAEGLDQHDKAGRGDAAKPGDVARAATFIDGKLTGAERDAFMAELARDPARRADVESAAALVEALDPMAPVPPELMAFARELGQGQEAVPARQSWWAKLRSIDFFGALSSRHRPVWAGVTAVLLVAVVGSGVLMQGDGPMPVAPSKSTDEARRSVPAPAQDRLATTPSARPPAAGAPPAGAPAAGTSASPPTPAPAERARPAAPAAGPAGAPPPTQQALRPDSPQPLPSIVQPGAALGGPFRLVDQNGRPFGDQDLKGRPFLLFFGSVNCPDVCAATLSEMSEVLRALGPDAGKANVLFVTVDPERDTPDKLKAFLARFDPRLRGLTGDPAAVDTMLKSYQVYARKVAQGSGYIMVHTTLVYLMDKQGRFVAPFNLKRPAAEAAAELRRYF